MSCNKRMTLQKYFLNENEAVQSHVAWNLLCKRSGKTILVVIWWKIRKTYTLIPIKLLTESGWGQRWSDFSLYTLKNIFKNFEAWMLTQFKNLKQCWHTYSHRLTLKRPDWTSLMVQWIKTTQCRGRVQSLVPTCPQGMARLLASLKPACRFARHKNYHSFPQPVPGESTFTAKKPGTY